MLLSQPPQQLRHIQTDTPEWFFYVWRKKGEDQQLLHQPNNSLDNTG